MHGHMSKLALEGWPRLVHHATAKYANEFCPEPIIVPDGVDVIATYQATTSLFIVRHPINREISAYYHTINEEAKKNRTYKE